MSRLLLILILTFIFQTLTKADDISDFQIEGISVGDSLLDYMSKKEIKSSKRNYLKNKKYYVVGYDENLENYIELHNWITSLGFPKDRSQFKSFRETTANTKVTSQGASSDIGDVKPATAERSMFSDATLSILTNKNNPVVEVRFADCFPTSISSLDYNQNVTDVDYLTADITFKYKIYEIHSL